MKLNLGCGGDIKPKDEWINLDRKQWGGVDVVRDMTRGLPFNDDTFDHIHASNTLEHIKQGEDLFFIMSECFRVLKPDATMFINVPHSDSPQAFFPDHLSYWNEAMFMALLHDPYQSYGNYKFDVVEMKRGDVYLYELLITLKALKGIVQ